MTDEHRALVAHLFRRAGFGASTGELDKYGARPYGDAVEALVNPDVTNRDRSSRLNQTSGGAGAQASLADAQEGWLKTMVASRAPLVERMTLFWANHFATAYDPGSNVDVAALLDQQATIRKYTLGSFADLAHAMIDDRALSCYLNNDRSTKAKPNENLARELMELFLLGLGTYTEEDVKETARALTGYHLVEAAPRVPPTLVYDKHRHDDGPKTILGVTANFTPHGVVDLLLNQRAARQHIATKLVTHFVGPSPDPVLVGTVASSLAPDWDVQKALRVIFYSQQFRSETARQTLPKTPAEFVVGLMRPLERTEVYEGFAYMAQAGQTLFRPPSVAGWPIGKRMLGPGAMLARYNAASTFARFHVNAPAASAPAGPELTSWMEAFGMTSLSPTTLDALKTYSDATVKQPSAVRTAGLLTVLLSSPDFNLA
ncbi:MAG: DUF1800 domain-containing protein [Actinobacteria bacterium]|nr:DUF1800 domain-containing protein [Actinomycetota bacterium]